MTVQQAGPFELVAGFAWSLWKPSRLYPDGPDFEYRTPSGGTVTVPGAIAGELRMSRELFGGYVLDDCELVAQVGPRELDRVWSWNLITNQGLEAVAKMLIDSSAAYNDGFGAVEVGTGGGSDVEPTVEDTTLVGGAIRKAIASKIQSSGTMTVTASLTSGTTAIYIREVGIYVATTDTTTLSAGDLFDHSATDIDNSGTPVNLTLTWVCSAQRKSSS